MKRFLIYVLFWLPVLIFSQHDAQDTILLDKVLPQLNLKKNDIRMELFRTKVLPYSEDKSVVVVPKYSLFETDEYGNDSYNLDAYIVLADNATGKILMTYFQANAWVSDAVEIGNLWIDTGLYKLNENTRAFGVRISAENRSQPNPYSTTDMLLVAPIGNQLKKVLDFEVARFGGEWDTRCNGEFEDYKAVLDLDKKKTNGFYNLIVKETTKVTKRSSVKGKCVDKEKMSKTNKILKFNGDVYK